MAAAPPLKAAARKEMRRLLQDLISDSVALNENLKKVAGTHKEDTLLRLCYSTSLSMESKLDKAIRLLNPNKPEKVIDHMTVKEVEQELAKVMDAEPEDVMRDIMLLREQLSAKIYKEQEDK
jgi:hypothetical protein